MPSPSCSRARPCARPSSGVGSGRDLFGISFAIHPDGQQLAVIDNSGVRLESLAGEGRRVLEDRLPRAGIAFDRPGQLLATATFSWRERPEDHVLQVLDLSSGEVRTFPLLEGRQPESPGEGSIHELRLSPDGDLLSSGHAGVHRWNTTDGTRVLVHPATFARMSTSGDCSRLLVGDAGSVLEPFDEIALLDLGDDTVRRVTSHGTQVRSLALNQTGRIMVTGSEDGTVAVGPTTDEAPRLLLAHDGPVYAVAISPDGRWVAYEAGDGLRLWAMPDLDEPPFHTLPHDQLLDRLDALSNLRAVEDDGSTTGWSLEVGPFPGWQDVPRW